MCKLMFRNIVKEWGKSLVTILSICISIILVFTSISVYFSFNNMRIENAYAKNGRYNLTLHNMSIENKDKIFEILNGIDCEIGVEKIYEADDVISLIVPDSSAYSMNYYSIFKGELPEKAGEITISPTYRYDGKYLATSKDIGDTIKIGDREYVIKGFLQDFDYSTSYLYKVGIISPDNECDLFNLYIHFASGEDMVSVKSRLCNALHIEGDECIEAQKAYAFNENYKCIENELLNWIEIDKKGTASDKNINTLIQAFILIIVITSIVLVIHIFSSYFNKRNELSDILKDIGFSKIQIFSCYLVESFILILIGTIIGLIGGTIVSSLITEFVQQRRMLRLDNFTASFDVNIYRYTMAFSFISIIAVVPIILKNIYVFKVKRFINKKNSSRKPSYIMFKIFLNDDKANLLERNMAYIVFILLSLVLSITVYMHRYTKHYIDKLREEDTTRAEFCIILDDIGVMEKVYSHLQGVTYYDVSYDTTAYLIDKNNYLSDNLGAQLFTDENGNIPCEVYSISESEYYRRLTISESLSYEEFSKSGGAILISSIGQLDIDNIGSISYAERHDEYVNFASGEIDICGSSGYKDSGLYLDLALVVTEEVFKEKFDYTVAAVYINVKKGYEIETANFLGEVSCMFEGFNFQDHVSEYIYAKDNETTIKMYSYLASVFIICCTIYALYYMYKHRYYRHKDYFEILKVLGYSNITIAVNEILVELLKIIPATIIANFILVLYCKKKLDIELRAIVCSDYIADVLLGIIVILIVQLISQLLNYRRVRV